MICSYVSLNHSLNNETSKPSLPSLPKPREDDHLAAAEAMAETTTGSIAHEDSQIDRGHLARSALPKFGAMGYGKSGEI